MSDNFVEHPQDPKYRKLHGSRLLLVLIGLVLFFGFALYKAYHKKPPINPNDPARVASIYGPEDGIKRESAVVAPSESSPSPGQQAYSSEPAEEERLESVASTTKSENRRRLAPAPPMTPRSSPTPTRRTGNSQVEENAQRLSGQLEELAENSNAAKGGAKTTQDTADAAVARETIANERISALDDYEPQVAFAIDFEAGSAKLSRDSKAKLDGIAAEALASKGYVLEVSGFPDSTGSDARNRTLSQRRADVVVRYMVENHNIPLQSIITPYGFGESNAVAENTARAGRATNRRVEIKLLVNRALNPPLPANSPTP
jgi:outer membrane protein OmpA-like peptidoglycan-associated protein